MCQASQPHRASLRPLLSGGHRIVGFHEGLAERLATASPTLTWRFPSSTTLRCMASTEASE